MAKKVIKKNGIKQTAKNVVNKKMAQAVVKKKSGNKSKVVTTKKVTKKVVTTKKSGNKVATICDFCSNATEMVCEDCGKYTCDRHCNRGTGFNDHDCDDSVQGNHSIWKGR